MTQRTATQHKAGFGITEWCEAAGISRATFYALPPEGKPALVYIGARPIITEPAGEWLARVRQGGGITIPPRKAKRVPETAAA